VDRRVGLVAGLPAEALAVAGLPAEALAKAGSTRFNTVYSLSAQLPIAMPRAPNEEKVTLQRGSPQRTLSTQRTLW
jgi:hypothetical protein